jgi:hypothetical protein
MQRNDVAALGQLVQFDLRDTERGELIGTDERVVAEQRAAEPFQPADHLAADPT